jgi:hypothetical protein
LWSALTVSPIVSRCGSCRSAPSSVVDPTVGGEDHLDVVGAADSEVVALQGFEEPPRPSGGVEHNRAEVSTCRIDSSHQ